MRPRVLIQRRLRRERLSTNTTLERFFTGMIAHVYHQRLLLHVTLSAYATINFLPQCPIEMGQRVPLQMQPFIETLAAIGALERSFPGVQSHVMFEAFPRGDFFAADVAHEGNVFVVAIFMVA